ELEARVRAQLVVVDERATFQDQDAQPLARRTGDESGCLTPPKCVCLDERQRRLPRTASGFGREPIALDQQRVSKVAAFRRAEKRSARVATGCTGMIADPQVHPAVGRERYPAARLEPLPNDDRSDAN